MTKLSRPIHVHPEQMLTALKCALLAQSKAAAKQYVPPKNSRPYQCTAPDCERPAYASMLCNAHYIRFRNGSEMSAPVRGRKQSGLCFVCKKECGTKGGWGMCPAHYRRARYESLKDAAVEAFGGACMECGGRFHRSVFDFHHYGDKERSPSSMFANSSLTSLASELSKCKLLCANCHRMEHFDEF